MLTGHSSFRKCTLFLHDLWWIHGAQFLCGHRRILLFRERSIRESNCRSGKKMKKIENVFRPTFHLKVIKHRALSINPCTCRKWLVVYCLRLEVVNQNVIKRQCCHIWQSSRAARPREKTWSLIACLRKASEACADLARGWICHRLHQTLITDWYRCPQKTKAHYF